jgi:hypothetical protein
MWQSKKVGYRDEIAAQASSALYSGTASIVDLVRRLPSAAAKERFENLHVRLTRDLQITRSHHNATNAVFPPAFPHGVLIWDQACTGVVLDLDSPTSSP